MLYLIVGEDTPNSLEKRLAVRPEHVARLQALQAEGRTHHALGRNIEIGLARVEDARKSGWITDEDVERVLGGNAEKILFGSTNPTTEGTDAEKA